MARPLFALFNLGIFGYRINSGQDSGSFTLKTVEKKKEEVLLRVNLQNKHMKITGLWLKTEDSKPGLIQR